MLVPIDATWTKEEKPGVRRREKKKLERPEVQRERDLDRDLIQQMTRARARRIRREFEKSRMQQDLEAISLSNQRICGYQGPSRYNTKVSSFKPEY